MPTGWCQLQCLRAVATKGESHHLDFPKRVATIVQKITRLSTVNAHDTEEQRAAQAQRKGNSRSHDFTNVFIDLVLQDLGFGEFFLHIGGHPDTGQRALTPEQFGGIKHGGYSIIEWMVD